MSSLSLTYQRLQSHAEGLGLVPSRNTLLWIAGPTIGLPYGLSVNLSKAEIPNQWTVIEIVKALPCLLS